MFFSSNTSASNELNGSIPSEIGLMTSLEMLDIGKFET
jgi:hypothetical protein